MKEVMIAPRLLSMLSPTPSPGNPLMTIVPSTIPISVAISSPVPTLSAQSPSALLTGSPVALSLQLEIVEDDTFAHEMSSPSIVRVAAVASATMVATMETRSRQPSKEPSEVTISLAAKDMNRRVRPRKEQKKSRSSQQE